MLLTSSASGAHKKEHQLTCYTIVKIVSDMAALMQVFIIMNTYRKQHLQTQCGARRAVKDHKFIIMHTSSIQEKNTVEPSNKYMYCD